MNWRARIRPWVPPAVSDARRRRLGHALSFSDVDGGWAAAQKLSTGYDAQNIVDRVGAATRKVLAGEARYERDSVLFHEPDFPYPIIASLLHAALAEGGQLTVVDFGGSLGSTYRQCAPLLRHVPSLQWHVIEQRHFVEVGRREFSTQQLHFWTSIDELPVGRGRCFLLMSSVLQYLEDPDDVLDDLLALNAGHMLIDRTPMSDNPAARLCLQHVPPSIYEATYPCWVLSRPQLRARLDQAGWNLLAELPGIEGRCSTPSGFSFEFRGLIAERP